MNSVETMDSEITEITRAVFESMLGWCLADSVCADMDDDVTPRMTGLVTVTGNWEGAVLVRVSQKLAAQIAATMFGSDQESAAEEELCDALGEMANMIGGNFKSMLEPPVQLSMPSVTEGVGYKMFIPGSKTAASICLEHEGEQINITVLSREAGA